MGKKFIVTKNQKMQNHDRKLYSELCAPMGVNYLFLFALEDSFNKA